MLTESGYLGALLFYVGAACLAIILGNIWLLRGRSVYPRLLLSLPVAALLLTPAYTEVDSSTLAPALVVTAFSWLSYGPDAAQHALRPLLTFSTIALGLAVALCIVVFLFSRSRRASEDS